MLSAEIREKHLLLLQKPFVMALKGIKTNTQKQNVKQGTKNEPQIVNVKSDKN